MSRGRKGGGDATEATASYQHIRLDRLGGGPVIHPVYGLKWVALARHTQHI